MGPSGPKKTAKNIATKGPSGPCVMKKSKWSTKKKGDPSASHDTRIPCGMSVNNSTNSRETPYKCEKGVNVRPL